MEKALARTEPSNLLAEVRRNPIEAISENYEKLAAVANVTFPVSAIDAIPPMMRPAPAVIHVSADEKSKDTYYITSDQRGLSKQVILKMLAAAGGQARTTKLSPDADLENIRWTAIVWRRLPNGNYQTGQGSKAWNWSKCQEQFVAKALDKPRNGETPDQAKARGMKAALQYREFADEQTETKALLRAARGLLGIKTSYSPEELRKPFLFLSLVPDIDISDPEIRRMAAQKAIDATYALYGAPTEVPSLPPAQIPIPPPEPTAEEFEEDADFGVEEEPEAEKEAVAEDPFTADEAEPEPVGPPKCAKGHEIVETLHKGMRLSVSAIVDKTIAEMGAAHCYHCYMSWWLEQTKKGAAAK